MRYVAIDKLELGGTPTHEEVHLRFRLVADPRKVPNLEDLRFGNLDEPITGSLELVYSYSLAADLGPEGALDGLRQFIAEHLDDDLVPAAFPVSKGSVRTKSRRDWVLPTVFLIGLLGLTSVFTVVIGQVVQPAIPLGIALALGTVVFMVLTAAGATGTIWAWQRRAAHGRATRNGHSSRLEPYLERDEEFSFRRPSGRGCDA